MSFKAVFFDLDGTLANSILDLAFSVNLVLERNGYPTHPVKAFNYFVGDGIPKMIERALPEDKRDSETLLKIKNEFLEYYSEHYADKTVAYPGLCDVVATLKSKGFKLAVVTNKAQEVAEKLVKKLYGDTFDFILGARPDIPAKPDPTGVFMVMEELGVTPTETAFVGDSSMDVMAGVNAGAYPIGVLWGYREKQELEKGGAKAFASDWEELLNIIVK